VEELVVLVVLLVVVVIELVVVLAVVPAVMILVAVLVSVVVAVAGAVVVMEAEAETEDVFERLGGGGRGGANPTVLVAALLFVSWSLVVLMTLERKEVVDLLQSG
jgi:hypothetical protein